MYTIPDISPELTIKNRLGLHARAAAKLAREAERFKSDIVLVKGGERADAKSVLSLMSLGCAYATRVRLEAAGEDASQAVSALRDVIENSFGEE